MVENLFAVHETQVQSLDHWEDPQRRKWQLTPIFCLGNPMDKEAWWAIIHGVAKSRIGLSDQTTISTVIFI